MTDEQQQGSGPAQFDRSTTQYPTTTKVEDGVAYDKTGKALGPFSEDNQQAAAEKSPAPAKDFFAQFGGQVVSKPDSQQSQQPQQAPQKPQEDFFKQFGGTVVSKPADETAAANAAMHGTIGPRQKGSFGDVFTAFSDPTGISRAGAANWFEDLKGDLDNGTDQTWVGWLMRKAGAKGLTYGVSPETGHLIGGPLYGPAMIGHGAMIAPEHPVQGANEIIGGVGTILGPAAVTQPEALPFMAIAGMTSKVAYSAATKMGADNDTAELIGNVAGIVSAGKMVGHSHMLDAFETQTNTYIDAQRNYTGRLREFENASRQAQAAEQEAAISRQLNSKGQTPRQTVIEMEEKASAARANATKAQEALANIKETRDQAGLEMRKTARRIQGTSKKVSEKPGAETSQQTEAHFKKAFPPTSRAPYDSQQFNMAMGAIAEDHGAVPVTEASELHQYLNDAEDRIDRRVGEVSEPHRNQPITTNPTQDVADALGPANQMEAGWTNKGLASIENFNLTDMTIGEAQDLITRLNDQLRGTRKEKFWDHRTALANNPEYAAKSALVDSLRQGVSGGLEEQGVQGTADARRLQAAVINVRDAMEGKLSGSTQKVRGTAAETGARAATAKILHRGAPVIGAVAAAKAGPFGMLSRLLHGEFASKTAERLGRAIAPGDLTRDQIAINAADAAHPSKILGSITEAPARPLPNDLPPPVRSQLSPDDVRTLMREQTPLHSELATHYGEHMNESTYEDLEKRFLADIGDKKDYGVALDASEKKILARMNEQNMTDAEIIRNANEKAAEREITNPTPQASLPKNAEGVLQAGALANGMSTPAAISHEIVHNVVGKKLGLPMMDEVWSHEHAGTKAHNADMLAPIDWKEYLDEEGNFDVKKIASKIDDIATTFVAGGVANDLWHDVPFTENKGLGADLKGLRRIMDTVGLSDADQSRTIAAATERARKILTADGWQDVIESHAAVREPGLASSHHVSEKRMNQIYEDLGIGGENEPKNSGKLAGNAGRTNEPAKGPGVGTGEAAKATAKEGVSGEQQKPAGNAKAAEGPNASTESVGPAGPKSVQPAISGSKPAEQPVDEYLYHAVDKSRVPKIQEEGLRAGSWFANSPEEAMRSGAVPISGNRSDLRVLRVPRSEFTAGTPDVADIGARGVQQGKYSVSATPNRAELVQPAPAGPQPALGIPPERTAGEHDEAIKSAGAIPGGVQKGFEYTDKVTGKTVQYPDTVLFHDPTSGTTLAPKAPDVTPEAVKQSLENSRAQYAAAKATKGPQPALATDRVSTRQPEGKNATENALEGDPLVVGREALMRAPEALQQKFADTVRKYPGVKIPKNIKDIGKVFDAFTDHVKDNLKFLYHDASPEKQVNNAKWYVSANKLAKGLSSEHGISEPQSAGVIATQSPQKDWDMNVSLARRITDIWKKQQDTVATPEMIAKAHDIIKKTGANEELKKMIPLFEGKKLSEVENPLAQAAWVRMYDEAHNPREFHYIDPGTGDNKGLRMNADGVTPSKVAWGRLPQIDNALSILKDGSRENISERLGSMHKVRNFYNNIIDPTNNMDVTIDTHAVAAGLIQPLGGSAKEVLHNFGAAGKHIGTGTMGTYPLYADAYRIAAKELGILPRELQSVVWEHVREMFPSEWKSPEAEAQVKKVWKKYSDGKASLEDTRQQVMQISEDAKQQVSDKRAETARKAAEKEQKRLDKEAKKKYTEAGIKALGSQQ
ncbi:Uncharacterised protein [uncultured archaeon]|nr:Uncharacterised protein [uncultured archaeon]